MNGVGFPLQRVLEGIGAATDAGFSPIKLNAVIRRGLNDGGLLDLARFGHDHGHIVRYIEFMDVGTTNGWRLDDVVPAPQILEVVNAEFPLEPLDPRYVGEVARRYRYRDGGGEIGLISSVSQPFCTACTRARLTADGKLFTCLSPPPGTTCAPSCARRATMPRSAPCSVACGASVATAIPTNGPRARRLVIRSRCPT